MKYNSMIQPSAFTVSYFDKKVIVLILIELWSTLDGTESIQDFQSYKGIMKDWLNMGVSMTDYSQTNYRDVNWKLITKVAAKLWSDQIFQPDIGKLWQMQGTNHSTPRSLKREIKERKRKRVRKSQKLRNCAAIKRGD